MSTNGTSHTICYAEVVDPTHLWHGVPTIVKPVPTLVMQMAIAMIVNHGLLLLLRRLRQPRIMSDILTAVVLSPSILNKIHHTFDDYLMPPPSFGILETMANLGLLYAMFMQGLHADLTPIAHKTTKTLALACSTFILPFAIGCASYLAFANHSQQAKVPNPEVLSIYWGLIVTATSFPTLAPILANHKLLCTNVGREALSIGLFNDVFTFALINFVLAITNSPADDTKHINTSSTWWVLGFMFTYMLFCGFIIKPIISRIVYKLNKSNDVVSDTIAQMIFVLVLAFGLLSDYFGSHFIFSAFVLGTSIPSGILSEALVEKMEDCVLGVLMPLYFAYIGTRVDFVKMVTSFKFLWIIVIALTSKALCTLPSAFFFNLSVPDSLGLGVLLSSKGLLPIVILIIGHERGHLRDETFMLLLLIVFISAISVGPLISIGYKQLKNPSKEYDQRCLEGANPTDELRLMACINDPQNVISIINLLEISNITTQFPASVFALHLVELVGHAYAMLIEHNSSNSAWNANSKTFFTRAKTQSENIIESFREYEDQNNATAVVQVLTVVSPIDTIHEDIISLSEDKQASLIILSFHKQLGGDGRLEDTNLEFGAMNQNVFSMAPCSVGLLVDRGLRVSASSSKRLYSDGVGRNREGTQIAMIFMGGPDDREALTYAWRMAGHPSVTLTIIRFTIGENAVEVVPLDNFERSGSREEGAGGVIAMWSQNERENQLDEDFLNAFQQKTAYDESILYVEKISNNGEETIAILRSLHCDFDLYLVGRGQRRLSPLTAGLAEWSECRELGPIGDVLVTSDFATTSSVLVIQQYLGGVPRTADDDKFSDEDGVLMGSYHQP